jgi:nitrous oxide reductase
MDSTLIKKKSIQQLTIAIAIVVATAGIIYEMQLASSQAHASSYGTVTASSSSDSPSMQPSMNNMDNTATMSMNDGNNITSSTNKNFYIFTTEVEGVNETKLGISGDIYSLQTMVVNKGDNVTVHFYNLEKDKDERHSFTIGAPYNINRDLAGGENATITFVADHEGVFQYHCLHHPPQMIGQLVVLPSAKATM